MSRSAHRDQEREATIHLRSVALVPPDAQQEGFPFQVPAIRSLAGGRLEFTTPVTLFVGENGSGKSTAGGGGLCGAGQSVLGARTSSAGGFCRW